MQQGPVGSLGPTPVEAGLPTPYQYTTTDANGNAEVIQATWTPSFVSLDAPTTTTTTGTILDFSAFMSAIGTNTVPFNAETSVVWRIPGKFIAIGVGLTACVIGGAFLAIF